MDDGGVESGATGAGAELHHAAGVAGGDDVGCGGGEVLHFAFQDAARHVLVGNVVDAGGAAAEIGVGDGRQFQAGYLLQQVARLLTNLLGVQQVAGVVVGHALGHRTQRPAQRFLGETFRNVLHALAEATGALGKSRVVSQQLAVALELCAAAGRVVDDDVNVLPLEHRDVAPRQRLGRLAVAGVHVQRPAAHLVARRAEPTAVGSQNPRGGVVHLDEQPVHDATGEEPHGARDRFPAGQVFRHAAGEGPRRQFRQHRLHILEARRQQAEHARRVQQPLHAAALVEAQQAEQPAQPAGVREQTAKHQPAQQSPTPGARRAAFDLAAGALHQVAELHVRRAGRLTGAAVEAQVHVLDEIRRHAQTPLVHRLDEIHAPARRVHFRAQRAIGGAFVQTEAAMNARADLLPLRTVHLIEAG